MLKLRWGKSLSWSHDVSSSVNGILSWIFPAAAHKWYCYAYLCVLQKKKKKKLPGSLAVSPLFSVLTGVFGSGRVQYLSIKNGVHRDDIAEAERLQLISIQLCYWLIGGFFKRKNKIMLALIAVQRSLLSAVIKLASPGLGLFPVCFPAVSGSETLMNPHQLQQRLHWEERSWSKQTSCRPQRWIMELFRWTKMRSECQISAMLLEPGLVLPRTGVASIFFYIIRL